MGVSWAFHTVVCFDLGGVVVRIARDWAEGCRAAGIEVREPARFHEPSLKAERRALAEAYQRGRISSAEFFEGVAANTGGLYRAEEVERVHDAWIYGEYPGVSDLIRRLNATPGVFTACLSNTNESHWERALVGNGDGATPSEAIALLRHRMASFEMGLVKPDATIYEAAESEFAAASGVTRGERVVFFDDLEDNVRAARDRGWEAHAVDHRGDTAGQMSAVLAGMGVLR
jgi:putative hydrolase of the HAD superfamily